MTVINGVGVKLIVCKFLFCVIASVAVLLRVVAARIRARPHMLHDYASWFCLVGATSPQSAFILWQKKKALSDICAQLCMWGYAITCTQGVIYGAWGQHIAIGETTAPQKLEIALQVSRPPC